LDESDRSITDLIKVLDARKNEAIEGTFARVTEYFEEVFEALVPAGKGQLIMHRRADEAPSQPIDSQVNEEDSDSDKENLSQASTKKKRKKTKSKGRKPQLTSQNIESQLGVIEQYTGVGIKVHKPCDLYDGANIRA